VASDPADAGEASMTDYVKAWQCIGCGRIEAPQPCIGVCQDRKVQFVYADEHQEALARAERAERQSEALKNLARKLAFTRPRAGEWEQSFRALQKEARLAMAALSDAAEPPSAAIGEQAQG
jgi:hypothetical protein